MSKKIEQLLSLSRDTASVALKKLMSLDRHNVRGYSLSDSLPKEFKAKADILIEKYIIEELSSTGLDILSEECGVILGNSSSKLKFIVDPIDGTVNFLRRIGNCSISIALFDDDTPVFGVLATYPSGGIAWGGKMYGSYVDGQAISVSNVKSCANGILCTGFPSRYEFNETNSKVQMSLMEKFGKVRMLGSASQSLLQIAKGSAECYLEREIMIWDIASGIAIVEGAGGRIVMKSGESKFSLTVVADNGSIDFEGVY